MKPTTPLRNKFSMIATTPALAYLFLVRSMRAFALMIVGCSVLTAGSQIVFDDGKPPTKERSPELEALNFLTGTWNSEFTVRETPESKEFKSKGIAVNRWSPNGQFLISDEWMLIAPPAGFTFNAWANKVGVTTWDPIKKEYRITDVMANATYTSVMTISRKGGTIQQEVRRGDHITKTTITFERVSDTETKLHAESSIDDGPKWVFLEGSAKKVSD